MINCKCINYAIFNNSLCKGIINIFIIIWFLSLIITIFEKIDTVDNNYLIITTLIMGILYKFSISHMINRYYECKK